MHLKEHIFLYTIVPLVIIMGVTSYIRFIVKNDYIVEYHGTCDPVTEKCFVECEDDACTQEYFYTKVQKYAPDLYKECGKDITDCENSNICLPNDRKCSVVYCDEAVKGDKCKNINSTNEIIPDQSTIMPTNNIPNPNI